VHERPKPGQEMSREGRRAPTCPECGSERMEYLQEYFATGAPNGEPEIYWQEAVRCRDCGEIEEF
jgi:hypothetical protein